MRLVDFLVNRHSDRTSLEYKGDGEHSVGPAEVRWRVRMREFLNAFVNRVRRTDTKDKNRRYERPEKPFLPVTERMLAGSGAFVKSQTQQEKDLVGRIRNGVERRGHHAGRASNNRCDQL